MEHTSNPFDAASSPGDVLRRLLDDRSWTQAELAAVLGCSRWTVIQLMKGRSGITPTMAMRLAHAFGNDPNDWLRLQAQHRLRRATPPAADVERRALLYGKAPIRDMQRRGWIKDTRDVDVLEEELKRFYRIQSLDQDPSLVVATRRSSTTDAALTPTQTAWCMQAWRIAEALPVAKFNPQRMPAVEHRLRQLAAYRDEVRHLPKVLAAAGIRFVVVEPLPGAKLDGAAFWLNDESPAIATSIRYDRNDSFWFTVMHECSHVRHHDLISWDMLSETGNETVATSDVEVRANREAAASLVPSDELESFIRRVAPLYSRQRIIQFANRIKMHPAIIVGQLHKRDEIGYAALRGLMEKVRDVVIETALTDGWGKSVPQGSLVG